MDVFPDPVKAREYLDALVKRRGGYLSIGEDYGLWRAVLQVRNPDMGMHAAGTSQGEVVIRLAILAREAGW